MIDLLWHEDPARADEAAADLFWHGEAVRERIEPSTRARHAQASRLSRQVVAWLDAPLLEVDADALVVHQERYPGLLVRLVNGGDDPVTFAAQDSRIAVVAEAQDEEGAWHPIEHLPSSWCGNSYHSVTLGSKRFVEFTAPRYEGPFETQVRWRLSEELVTEPVTLSIHPDQLTHSPEKGRPTSPR